jgi:hypothetical protein
VVAAIVIGVITAVVVVVGAIVLLRGGNPEATASHPEDLGEDTPSWDLYRGVDRPAGPDVENTADPAVPPTLPADEWNRHDGRTP